MALVPGSTVGSYRIMEPLGRGGMAAVYKAYEAALDRHVALKVLPAEFLHDLTFAERFRQEARVVASLEHPNIVPIHGFGIEDGVPWMAMRLVPGGALSSLLKKERLPASRVMAVLAGVAAALDYAHAKGVVHRDVKPQNVLLDEQERVYLADFGISKMLEGSSSLTATGMIQGTPHYMSPEQATSRPVDHRTDLYALGIMAYEMLTGKVPFAADTPVAVLLKHVTEPLPLPSQMDFPDGAVRAILKCVAKKPEDRWATGRAFVEALAAGLEGQGLPSPATATGTLTLGPSVLETLNEEVPAPAIAPPGPARPAFAWTTAAMAFGALALTTAAAVAWFTLRPSAGGGPVDRTVAVERKAPGSEAPTIAVGDDAMLPAKLAVSFDHAFKNGSLRIVVDDRPVLVRQLLGKATKKLVAFKGWKGSVDEVVEVPAGPHTVRVQVSWDDNVKSASVRAEFTAGATRHLDIQISGLKKNVELDWK